MKGASKRSKGQRCLQPQSQGFEAFLPFETFESPFVLLLKPFEGFEGGKRFRVDFFFFCVEKTFLSMLGVWKLRSLGKEDFEAFEGLEKDFEAFGDSEGGFEASKALHPRPRRLRSL